MIVESIWQRRFRHFLLRNPFQKANVVRTAADGNRHSRAVRFLLKRSDFFSEFFESRSISSSGTRPLPTPSPCTAKSADRRTSDPQMDRKNLLKAGRRRYDNRTTSGITFKNTFRCCNNIILGGFCVGCTARPQSHTFQSRRDESIEVIRAERHLA